MHFGFAKAAYRTVALLSVLFAIGSPSLAQVTAEQQNAIRSSCRSDFMSNCSGVTRGGKEALQCLQRNVEKLSPACKTAVSVTIPAPAAPAPAPAAAAAPPAAAVPTPAPAPTPAAASPAATTPAAPSMAAPSPAPAQKPATAKPAVAAKPAAPAAAPVSPPPAVAPEPAAAPLRQATLRELVVVRRLCAGDIEVLCRSVPPGDGRIVACLASQQPALSPGCRRALDPLRN